MGLEKRIKKEMEQILIGDIVGFFAITITEDSSKKPDGTVTFICDKSTKGQGDLISQKLTELMNILRSIFA